MMRFRALLLALVLLVTHGYAQPSGESILKRVEAGLSEIQDYAVDLDVTADIERMNVPPMHVRMFYKSPDKFHFDSDGFAMLPRDGLAFSANRVLARFSVERVESVSSSSEKAYQLLLKPKDPRGRVVQLIVEVGEREWKPKTITSLLADGRTMTAEFQYEPEGPFLMPSTLTVKFTASASDTTERSPVDPPVLQRPALPRNGTILVRYSHYAINTGLPDELFENK